jgi:hypothetical protein
MDMRTADSKLMDKKGLHMCLVLRRGQRTKILSLINTVT